MLMNNTSLSNKRSRSLSRKPLASDAFSGIFPTFKWTDNVKLFGIVVLCLLSMIIVCHYCQFDTAIGFRLPIKQIEIVQNSYSATTGFGIAEITAVPPRLLFMAASYKMDQFLYLQKTLDVMRDHCNAGWNITVHLQVAGEFSLQHPRYVEIMDRSFCVTNSGFMNIIIENYNEIGFGLNCKHRIFMRDHLHEFDYFSYAEEDMLLTVSHLRAFLHAEKDLQRQFPNDWKRFVPGFLR